MIEPVWIVGFSGHRPGDGPGRRAEQLRACREPLRDALRRLQACARDRGGRIELLTGVAAGADLEAAEAAGELELPVHVILPMYEAQFAADFTSEEAPEWQRAERLIEKARRGEAGGTLRVATGGGERPDCYHEAAQQMLACCDLLLVVWNGQEGGGIGGTTDVVEQADRIGRPVMQIDPADPGRVVHRRPIEDWPPRDAVLREMDEAAEHEARAYPSMAAAIGVAHRAFQLIDQAATRMGLDFRARLTKTVLLHYVAALLAAANAALIPIFHAENREHPPASAPAHGALAAEDLVHWMPEIWTGLELLLVVWAWLLMRTCAELHLSHGWRESRFAAEVLRGIRETAAWLDPLRPLVAREAPEWRRFAVSLAIAARREAPAFGSLEAARDAYLQDRIIDQRDRYFRERHKPAERQAKWLGLTSSLAGAAAPIFIFGALVAKIAGADWVRHDWHGALFASWIPIALPLIAGAATSLMLARDAARRTERYRRMAERLQEVAVGFPGLKTTGAIREAVSSTEEVLVDELIEWYAAARTTGH